MHNIASVEATSTTVETVSWALRWARCLRPRGDLSVAKCLSLGAVERFLFSYLTRKAKLG